VVPPGASAGSPSFTGVRTRRITLGRNRVIVRPIPIAAPFMHVLADIVESEPIRNRAPDRFRAGLPALAVVGQRLRRVVTPGKKLALDSAACGPLPLGLGGEAILPAGDAA
jgi:hypothetical protein